MKVLLQSLLVAVFSLTATATFADNPVYRVSVNDLTLANAGPEVPVFQSACAASGCVDWWNGLGWGAIDPTPGLAGSELLGADSHTLMNLDGVLLLIDKDAFSVANGLLSVPAISNGFFTYEGSSSTRFLLQVTMMDSGITNLGNISNIPDGYLPEVEPSDGGGGLSGDDWDDEFKLDHLLGEGSHWSPEYAWVMVDGVMMNMAKHTIHALVHSGAGELVEGDCGDTAQPYPC